MDYFFWNTLLRNPRSATADVSLCGFALDVVAFYHKCELFAQLSQMAGCYRGGGGGGGFFVGGGLGGD